MAKICIIMGSKSDLATVNEGIKVLKEFKVKFDVRVLSAHRTPYELAEYVDQAPKKGTQVFIAAAGGAAALAGVIAAHTVLPVIGIPIETSSLKGMDSLLSTVQMPGGVPVASMAIGKAGAKNAALFVLAILGLGDKKISAKLLKYKKQMRNKIKKTKIKV
ncbi:MAG: 5-(carboxyamino)imidazole ribonucleotide mutase [Candidatus Omnitrophica bacterium]|nr:5-(carboxyamino)imidazole ribonucleotide mutase [Candidatus Omnitrophota bacterium]MDD5661407.1 5-(carboxyamino)imidazole ribonucleotide mutase [Candidatus Omnitrophota bacterium]